MAFDHGASWLHDADDNPLLPIALTRGFDVLDTATVRHERTHIGARAASPAELAAYAATETRLVAALAALAEAGGADPSLAEAITRVATPDDAAWTATVEHWEGATIAAADAGALSLRDWHRNRLGGRNMLLRGGLGAFVRDGLAPAAGAVRLDTPVRGIAWGGRDVAVETPAGIVRAKSCIVTVSTGVLAAGRIAFTPRLPDAMATAIAGLPMGLLSKVALRATGDGRLGLPAFTSLDHRLVRRGAPAMSFNCWPYGHDHVIGFIGGSAAWDLSRQAPAASVAFARDQLRDLFGGEADRVFAGGGAVTTEWGTDPCHLGAYCYACPGQADARSVLAAGLAAPRLHFAGEALHPTHGGTVGGAFVTGQQAARAILTNAKNAFVII